jgi:acylphosphatase
MRRTNVIMKRVILHISGNVQRAGYRTKVISIAKQFGIKGIVQNLADGRVKIIAEGEQTYLDKFILAVNIKNTLINVIGIEQEYSVPSKDFEKFYKLVDEGETDERLDTAADLLKNLIGVTINGFDRLENNQKIMIEKQDETIGKIDQSRIETTSEIHALRDDFKSHIDARLSNVESEIVQIKEKIML